MYATCTYSDFHLAYHRWWLGCQVYLLAELDLEEAPVEVSPPVGAAGQVLLLVALVVAPGPGVLGAPGQRDRSHVWRGGGGEHACLKNLERFGKLKHYVVFIDVRGYKSSNKIR